METSCDSLPDKPIALVHAKGRIALDGCSFRNVQLSAPASISATLVTEDDAAVTNCTFACMDQIMGNINYGGAKGGAILDRMNSASTGLGTRGSDPSEYITTDQLGQEFTKPPIGAVTLKRLGTAVIVR